MQLPVPFSSQGWSDKILWLVMGLFGGGGVATIVSLLLNHILSRKQQDSTLAKNAADAQHTTLDGLVKSSNQILVLMDRLNRLEGDLDDKSRQYEESVRFYRKQIEYFEARVQYYVELDLAYRNRSHDINGEMNLFGFAVSELELKYVQETKKDLDPIPRPDIDGIVKKWPLPVEPPGTHDGKGG